MYVFDAAHHGESNDGLSFVIRGQQRQKNSLNVWHHQFWDVKIDVSGTTKQI